MQRKNTGFTAIELMIVVAIIAILVSITTNAYFEWYGDSNNKGNIEKTESIQSDG